MGEERQVRVSYIMTTRNRAKFLARTLENVREFITPEDELIIMDGGSTDDTADVVAKHRDIVALFRSEPDFGEAHACNKAILESRGRFIKFITDDDYTYPGAMRYAIEVMEKHPELDAIMCGGEAYEIDPCAQSAKFVRFWRLPSSRHFTHDIDNDLINIGQIGGGISLLIHSRVIPRVGLFDNTMIATDVDYICRLITNRVNIKYLDVKLYRYTLYQHSNSRLAEKNGHHDAARISLRYWNWPNFIKGEPAVVLKELGLSKIRKGDLLLQIILASEYFRQSRFPILRLLLIELQLLKRLQRVWGWLTPQTGHSNNAGPQNPNSVNGCLPESVWDGNLR